MIGRHGLRIRTIANISNLKYFAQNTTRCRFTRPGVAVATTVTDIGYCVWPFSILKVIVNLYFAKECVLNQVNLQLMIWKLLLAIDGDAD